MKFVLDYKKPKNADDEFEINAYASFCMSYVDQLKRKLNFQKQEKEIFNEKENKNENILRFSMDLAAYVPINKCKRIKNKEDKVKIKKKDKEGTENKIKVKEE